MTSANKFIIMRTFIKDQREASSKSIKIRNYNYGGEQLSPSSYKFKRYNENEPNPIKVVVDMIGEDGSIHQEIINQNCELQQRPVKNNPFKFPQTSPNKQSSLPVQSLSSNLSKQIKTEEQVRSFVFNRYNYDNYKSLSISNSRKSLPSKRKVSDPNHKNIEIVFCENKLPQFVAKTNQKIEEIYKQEKIIENTARKQALTKSQHGSIKHTASVVKPAAKTNFANCIKQYATLEKLSVFMENQRNLKSKHFCHSIQTDPSRNLLLDIITHRFSFLKNMNKSSRDRIYRSLLARQIYNQTKINIQEYMKLYQMFVGRDAKPADIATFMYIFLFGNQVPSLELAHQHLERLNGKISRLRIVLKEIQIILEKSESNIVESLCVNQKLLRHFIDYILER